MSLPPLALLAGAATFLLPVVFSPSVQAVYWTPGAALGLLVLGVGLPLLARVLADPAAREAAVAAVAFLAVACLSTAVSHDPMIGTLGLYGWGTGLLYVGALVAAWSIGRCLDGRGAATVERALVAAVGVNAVFAVLQSAVDLTVFTIGLYGGRAHGLLGNPVHLAGFGAAGIALVASRLDDRRRWAWLVVLVSASVQLSGSRIGIGLVAVVVAVHVVRSRRRGALLAMAVIAGMLAAAGVDAVADGQSITATARVQGASASGGFRPRMEMWRAAVGAVGERPILGHGPGQFRTATSDRRDEDMVRSEGPEVIFTDAHNVVVEYLTTTGVLGLALLAAWLVLAGRGAGGPLLAFAATLLASLLLQPQWVRTTPLAFLALGAARGQVRAWQPVGLTVARAVTTLGAAAAAAILLVGDFHLDQGRLDFTEDQADRAIELLPPWPEPATLQSQIHLFQERTTRDPRELDAAIEWRRRAVERDDTNSGLWNNLGETELTDGRLEDAVASFTTALRHDPVSVRALIGLGHAWTALDEHERAIAAYERALELAPTRRSLRALLTRLQTR